MAQTIMIVDDEIDILEILSFNLRKAGFEVLTATSGEAAIDKIAAQPISLVLLDVMMTGINGYDTARRLREQGHRLPIIFLTAKDTQTDILEGFATGADDYISKPFSLEEVLARVKAVLARVPNTTNTLSFNELSIDTVSKAVFVNSQPVTLTKTEFEILSLLMMRPNILFSHRELINGVWGYGTYIENKTVNVHISRLRNKLGTAGNYIVNRVGYGYGLED